MEATRMGSTRTNLQTKPVRRRQSEAGEVAQQLVEEIEDAEEFNAELADIFDDGRELADWTNY